MLGQSPLFEWRALWPLFLPAHRFRSACVMPSSNPSPEDGLLRPREVAEMFGVRPTTIARWAREGFLKSVATPGGHRRYRRAEIITALNSVPSDSVERQRFEQDAVRLYEQGWSIRRV